MNEILSEELENEIIKNMEENDFFFIFEYFAKKNNLNIALDKSIVEQFWKFLKYKKNRDAFEKFIKDLDLLDEWSKKQYLSILNKIDGFYSRWNSMISISAINNPNYKKSEEEILAEETSELIYKILIKKWNKKETLSNFKVLEEWWENINVFMDYYKLRTWNIVSVYTNDLVDLNLYSLLEFLNVFSQTKFKYLNFDRSFYEKISILDIWKRFNFYDNIFVEIKYLFIENWKIINRKWILSENWDILNLESNFFITHLFWEFDLLWFKFLKAWDENWTFCLLDIHSNALNIRWKYVYNIEESKLNLNWKKYYEMNNWVFILSEDELLNYFSNYTSFDLSNIEVEEIYD